MFSLGCADGTSGDAEVSDAATGTSTVGAVGADTSCGVATTSSDGVGTGTSATASGVGSRGGGVTRGTSGTVSVASLAGVGATGASCGSTPITEGTTGSSARCFTTAGASTAGGCVGTDADAVSATADAAGTVAATTAACGAATGTATPPCPFSFLRLFAKIIRKMMTPITKSERRMMVMYMLPTAPTPPAETVMVTFCTEVLRVP